MTGSLLIIFNLNISRIVEILLLITTLGYGSFILWRDILLQGSSNIQALQFNQDGWVLRHANEKSPAKLCGDSTVTRWVCVLRFKLPEKKRKVSCVIFRDALEPTEYRRLLVTARMFSARV
jgi:hypothetical protein